MAGSRRASGETSFGRSVGVLLSGASVAQLINLLLLPVLTLFFSPGDFDILAVFTAITITTFRGACLGFDYALPIAESDEDAVNLLAAALLGLLLTSTAVAAVTLIALPIAFPDGAGPGYSLFVWLVPLGTLLSGANMAFEYWNTRAKRFRLTSVSRIGQVSLGGAVQILLGLAGAGPGGLLIGYMLTNSAGSILFAGALWMKDRQMFSFVSRARIRDVVHRYRTFPKYTAAEAVVNSCFVYLPLIIIAAVAIGPEAGFLLLALRLTQSPAVMLTTSVSQVYHSRALAARREGRLGDVTAAVLKGLITIAAGPAVALAIVAPDLAEAALGLVWRPTGVYIVWILPSIFLLLLTASILPTMHTLGRNADILYLSLFGLVMRLALVGLAAVYAVHMMVAAYAVSGAIFYALSLVIFMRVNHIRFMQILPRDRLALAAGAGVIGAAILLKLLLKGSL